MSFRFLLIGWMVFLFSACYEKREGCLDNLASNYDVSADFNCEQCCIFPSFAININHNFTDNVKFALNDTFTNNLGDRFVVLEQKFYLSRTSIYNNGILIPFRSKERIQLKDKSKIDYVSDYCLFTGLSFQETINTIRNEKDIDSLSFTFGLSSVFDNFDPTFIDPISDLSKENGMLDINGKYRTYHAKMIGGENLRDTFFVSITSDVDFRFVIKPSIQQKKGSAAFVNLNLYYGSLFKDVDFKTPKMNIEAIEKKMAENFTDILGI